MNLLDPNAIKTSYDTIDFELIMSNSQCLNTVIQTTSIDSMEYFIDVQAGSPLVQTFTGFTDTVSLSGYPCGNILYTMTLSDPLLAGAITLPAGTTDLTIQTTDMNHVGRYTATIVATLNDYPEFDDIFAVSVTVSFFIDNGCLHTKFILGQTLPTMIQFYGRSTTDSEVATLSPVADTVSQANGNNDGFTYCGPRMYDIEL